MKTSIKNLLVKLTEESPNEEICGILYTNFNQFYYYPCKNISINPEHTFEISSQDYLKVEALGKIFGIFHSHVKEDSNFSENDKNLAEEIDLPIFCYSSIDKIFREYRPPGYKVDLMGREFIRGVFDCYSLVRDYYWNNFEYLLDDFCRDDDYDEKNNPIILNNFESQGFLELEIKTNIKPNDVLIYKSMKNIYPHHFEIFIGNSTIIHHLRKRISSKDQISPDFFKSKYRIVRFTKFEQKKYESILK